VFCSVAAVIKQYCPGSTAKTTRLFSRLRRVGKETRADNLSTTTSSETQGTLIVARVFGGMITSMTERKAKQVWD